MKNKILTAVSTLALIGAMPALAQAADTKAQSNAEATTTGNIGADAKTAWKNIKNDMSDAYKEIKGVFIGSGETDEPMPVVISSQNTASGIIGHQIYNEKHENLGKVTDIILDHGGKAVMVVVSDHLFMGMGKDAAFDYSAITRVEADGDVIMPLTDKMVDNAVSFSYRQEAADAKTRVMPNDGYSVSRLLKGRLLNERREAVADIEDISFKNARANQIIVGFDKTLGFGGQKAVLAYNDTTIVRNGDALDFQLSANNSVRFESYKNDATN